MVDYLINNRTEGCPYNVIHNILDGDSTPSDKSKAIQIIDDHIQDNSRQYLEIRSDTYKYVNSIELARSLTPPNTIDVGENVIEGYLNDLLSLEYEEFFQFENVQHHFITVQLDIVYYLIVNVLHHSFLSYQQLDDIRSQFKDIQFIERQTPIFKYQSQETTNPYLTIDDQALDKWNTFIAFEIILIEVISAMKLTLNLRDGFTNAISTLICTGSTIVIPILFSNYYKKSIGICIDSKEHPESSTLFDIICKYGTLGQVKAAHQIVQEYGNDKLLQWSLHKANRPLLITARAASEAAKTNNLEVLKYLDDISESKLAPFHLKVSRFDFQAKTTRYLISTRPNSLLPHYSYQRVLETLDLDFINWYDNFVNQNQSIIDQFKMKDKKNGQRNDYPIIFSRYIIENLFEKSNQEIINLLEYIINKYNITNNLDSIKGIFKSEDIIYNLMSECCERGNLEIFKWLELNLNLSSQSKIQQPQRIATTIFDDAYLNGMNDDLVEYLIENRFEGFGPESWKYVGESGDEKQLQLMIRGTNQQQHNQLFNTIAKFAIRKGNMKILNQNMIPNEIISLNLTNCNIRHTIRHGRGDLFIQMYLKQATINEIESILQHSIRSGHPRCTKLIYQELIKQQKQQSIPPYQLTIKDQLYLISIEDITLLDYFIQQQSLDPKLIDRKQFSHMTHQFGMIDQMKRYLLDKGFNSKWEPSTKVQLESKSLRFNTTTSNREKSPPKERSIRLVFGNVYLLRKILRETRFTQSGYRVSIPMDIRLDLKWLLSKKAYNWIKYLVHRKEPLHVSRNTTPQLVNIKDVELFQVVYDNYRSSFLIKPGNDDQSCWSSRYDYTQTKREQLAKLPSGSDPFFRYDPTLLGCLMPSKSFSQDINIQIMEERLKEDRDDFIYKFYSVKINKPILDYLFNHGVLFKRDLIDSLLNIGDDERLNDIDPMEFSKHQISRCASYEHTQNLVSRFLSISYARGEGSVSLANVPLSVFSQFNLGFFQNSDLRSSNRRDCFKLVIDKLKEETKEMDLETGKITMESVVDIMVIDRLVESNPDCSTLMLDYCLDLITKDLPSGILSQKKMEHCYCKLVESQSFDLALVVSKYFNIRFDNIIKKYESKIPFQAAIFFGNTFNLTFEDFPIELLSHLSLKQQDFLKDKFNNNK
ncbi:hypothetical protein DFA_09306 [Cavenderia fasciculata]|uniref:Uncharacterized protein n=1 Tax=Cavenderia fasciculata TaxID=261658 RepID=F4Q794_CACFS|nr:uncharacterized protein DFA_09306 [Cavenderia fasciculata]EGG16276.1 hypothetical protein DFA_09306 [Cavenderia fasciculata]|eukprot:XP_004354660.1 hypothetical protein DFA_09306 [Cavenderia fasciculata]